MAPSLPMALGTRAIRLVRVCSARSLQIKEEIVWGIDDANREAKKASDEIRAHLRQEAGDGQGGR